MSLYISIVVPAFNEESTLDACLESLLKQENAPAFEIIVVDNNSTDNTAQIAKAHGVRVIKETVPGVCAARDAGLQSARGEIIVSTDADCMHPPDWLARIAQAFQSQPDLVLLCGNYRFTDAPRWANASLVAYEWLCLQLQYAFGWYGYVSAANLAFRRSSFGGYDVTLTQGGDELYILGKLRKQGRVLYRFTNPILTSGRRMKQGFTKTFFKDFLVEYIVNYYRTRRTGKNIAGTSKAHRHPLTADEQPGLHIGAYVAYLFALFLLIVVVYLIVSMLVVLIPNLAIRIGSLVALTLGVISYAVFNPHSQLGGPQPFRCRTQRQIVALTFDDGPNGKYSLEIADVIEQYGAKATFFQVGQNVKRQPDITMKLHDRGHLIGNHSLNHSYVDYFRAGWRKDIEKSNMILEAATGQRPVYARLPWLFRTPWVLKPLYDMGLQPVAGTFVSIPEFRQRDGVAMARKFADKVKPGDILIMHDGYNAVGGDRSETVNAVRELTRILAERGFSFVRIDEML